MPEWKQEIRQRLAGLKLEPVREAEIVEELAATLQSLKVNLSEMLRSRQTMFGGTRGSRLYALLIGAQVALSFFLLYGAVVCVAAARRAASFDPGFDARHVLSTKLFVQSGAAGPRNWDAFHRALTDRIAALPGVQSVAYTDTFPFASSWGTDVRTPLSSSGRPVVVGLVIGLVLTVAVLPGLVPILRNWDFTLNIWDPISYGVTAILLATVALWAMLIPARRATEVDPMMALREE